MHHGLEQMGVTGNDAIVESTRQAPRWAAIEMSERTEVHHGRDIAILAYYAYAHLNSGTAYRAVCTSAYIREDDEWQIAQHQQTLLG